MRVIESENVVCYDVDDTLVMWDYDAVRDGNINVLVEFLDPHTETRIHLVPHGPHIELLKRHKARGKYVIVWSQGGYEWASTVVKTLGLTEYVDQVMSKPRSYVDDLPVDAWLKDRIYISPGSNWGKGITE